MSFKINLNPEETISVTVIDDGPGDDPHYMFYAVDNGEKYRYTFAHANLVEFIKARHEAREKYIKS